MNYENSGYEYLIRCFYASLAMICWINQHKLRYMTLTCPKCVSKFQLFRHLSKVLVKTEQFYEKSSNIYWGNKSFKCKMKNFLQVRTEKRIVLSHCKRISAQVTPNRNVVLASQRLTALLSRKITFICTNLSLQLPVISNEYQLFPKNSNCLDCQINW